MPEESSLRPDDAKSGIDRREMLNLLLAAGGGSTIGAGTVGAAQNNGQGSSPGTSGERTKLGDFETGLDGWTTNGGNSLSRVSDSVGVASGDSCLRVDVDGDNYPMIRNSQVRDIDFQANPYLEMYVVGIVAESDANLQFKFRLHYTPSGNAGGGSSRDQGNGNGTSSKNKGNGNGKGSTTGNPNVVESDVKPLSQLTASRVRWDMSDISDDILQSAHKLEISWYLEGYELDGQAAGKDTEGGDYEGMVLIDDIRITDSEPVSGATKRSQKFRQLHRNHGRLNRRRIETTGDDFEEGSLVFADGTEVPFTYEVFDDRIENTIDGETFVLMEL